MTFEFMTNEVTKVTGNVSFFKIVQGEGQTPQEALENTGYNGTVLTFWQVSKHTTSCASQGPCFDGDACDCGAYTR